MKMFRLLGGMVAAATVMTVSALASDGWMMDHAKAFAKAKAENKPLLVDFTGSDWCTWCMVLKKEVFSQKEFKDYAQKNFVLLEVDFPMRKPLSNEQKRRNEALKEKYGVIGFPTVLVLNPDGQPLGKLNYEPGGPKAFIEKLEKIVRK